MKIYDTIIFDLDGTLLDSLNDIHDNINITMEKYNFEKKSRSEVKNAVGHGAGELMAKCIPNGRNNPKFDEALNFYKNSYLQNVANKTKPYDGIYDLLKYLKSNNYKIAIASNKCFSSVQKLKEIYFRDYISVSAGESKTIRKKPNPDTVLYAINELKSSKDKSLYIGDSEVDILTAKNLGINHISVSWGFKTKEFLKENGAEFIVNNPHEIIEYLEK